MLRIAYRTTMLLLCGVALVGLIAARPLGTKNSAEPPHTQPQLRARALPQSPARAKAPADAHASVPARARSAARISEVDLTKQAQRTPAPRPVVPARIAGDGPALRGQLVAQTERLDFYVGKNSFSAEQVAALGPAIERALRNAERHFGTTLDHRVSIGFYRTPPERGVRGMAYTDSARADLFYRAGEDTGRAVTIATHELGHHLEAQRYGEAAQRRADTILHEGLATWIADDRWLPMCEAITWRQRARELRDAGIPMRLLTAERSGADNAYELWASFVDFLDQRYGRDQLNALYLSGRGRAPGSANYQKVLGKSLDDLADEWRAWVGE